MKSEVSSHTRGRLRRLEQLIWFLVPLALSAPAFGQEDKETAPSQETPPAAEAEKESRGDVPTLARKDAISIAVEHNHDVRISRTETDIAERNVSLGNAGFLPTIEGVASQNHVFGGSGLFGSGQIFTRTSMGVQLDWLLFGGFGRISTYDRLQAVRSASQLETEAAIEETLVSVTTSYWNVVRQRELLNAIAETRDLSEERVRIARGRLEAEMGSRVDVNLARVELSRDRSSYAEQRIALVEAKTELNRVLGRPADKRFRVDGQIEIADSIAYHRMRKLALENNRRLLATKRRRTASVERVDEAQAQRWPRVNLGLGYIYTGFHSGVTPNFDVAPSLEYTISLSVPIFDGFNINREIENSKSERVVSDYRVEREKTRIRAAVRNSHEAYRRHLERVELAENSVGLARDNVEVAMTQLEAGTITQVELRQVQLNLLDAQTRLINAKYEAKQAELELLRLTGQLYDREM